MKSLGDRIREAREAAGMTQEELGKALGTSRNHVNDWENDRYGPSPAYASMLARMWGGEAADWKGRGRGRAKPRDEGAELVRLLADQMEVQAQLSREILDLLTQIRDSVARP